MERQQSAIGKIIGIILYVIVAIGVVSIIVSLQLFPKNGFLGSLFGVITALLIYAIAIRTGKLIILDNNNTLGLIWLFGSQIVLWVLVGLGIVQLHLNPLAFLIGFSSLLLSIIVGLIIWTFQNKSKN